MTTHQKKKHLEAMDTTHKKMRKIHPLGFRVLLEIENEGNISDGGLYLPEGSKRAMSESIIGLVIEVASAGDPHMDEETNVSGIPLGARVLVGKNAGVTIPWDDNLRLVETKEVLAIIEEIEIT